MQMKHHIHIETATVLISTLFMLLFLLTGVEKVWYHGAFHIMLDKQPLPHWMKALLDWGLPLAELAVAGLLVAARTRLAGLYLSALLMLAFTVYTRYAASIDKETPVCACGKLFSGLSWAAHFWVNSGITVIAITGIWLYHMWQLRCRDNDTVHGLRQATGGHHDGG